MSVNMSLPLQLVVAFLTCFVIVSHSSSLNKVLFDGDYEFIDLTYPFDAETIYWPNTRSFEFTKKDEGYYEDGSWYAANEFAAGEHGGTHIDAPYHFDAQGKQVGDIPLEKLIVPYDSSMLIQIGTQKSFFIELTSYYVCKAGLYNLENVKLDSDVPEYGCTAFVMPMKIRKGTGAPVRLAAVCPKRKLPDRF
ncbi:kynurenine formamidase-like [Aricia agestis]|uniref:kynurenine formamidase-like n=1 Tax=Aricia agestis TaxID=91739 RepID=UPI001C209699|nr:kynurenine formamidase-like [Aricia agestis]